MAFLKNVLIENGYKEDDLRKIIVEVTSKSIRPHTKQISSECINSDQRQTTSLPWIPGMSGADPEKEIDSGLFEF